MLKKYIPLSLFVIFSITFSQTVSNQNNIAGGYDHNLFITPDFTVIALGRNSSGQSTVPEGLSDVVAVSAGRTHSMALHSDGTVTTWGGNSGEYNNAQVPEGLSNVVAISAGRCHSMALISDGTVVAWGGENEYGQYTVPEGLSDVVAIAAGGYHSIVVHSDGTVTAWGMGENSVPEGLSNIIAVSAGDFGDGLALSSDGLVTKWAGTQPPETLSDVVAISAGGQQDMTLSSDGTITIWGSNEYGQSDVPEELLSNIVAISSGYRHSLALLADGTIIGWGANHDGQLNSSNQDTYIGVVGNNLTALVYILPTYVPDDNFEQALIDLGYDDVLDDYVLTENISGVTYLDVDDKGISDLTGIEGFTAVTDLRIRYNQLTSLDVSNNTALLTIRSNENQLTNINVSNNAALTGLSCAYNNLSELDMSNNPLLDFLECRSNQLTTLDMRNGVTDALTTFDAMNNSLSCILVNEQDVDWATENWTHENNNIDEGVIFDPECLDLGNTYVPDDNFEQALIDLGYDDVLDDSVMTANINSVTTINVGGDSISDLTGIEDFTALTHLNCANNQLTELDVSANTALTSITCYYNELTSLDVSTNTGLDTLNVFGNQLTSLDVSANTALSLLSCQMNELTSLDVSNNTALTYLHCPYNELTSLNVSNNTALTTLSCVSNQLTELDVSNNTALTGLSCGSNQLTELDVSVNTALTYLSFFSNQLTSVDVSNNTALIHLYSNQNQLTSLDVSNNTALSRLQCHFNQLTSLDVSANTALTLLSCGSNQLTELDVSNNPELFELQCQSNQLTSLDLSNNPELLDMKCQYNELSSLNLKGRHPSEYETVEAFENWSLECVDVLDPQWALDNWEEYFDRDVQFEFICGAEDRSQWHVSSDGSNNTGDGSAENPLETIQLAIDVSSNGDTVFAAAGTYVENISFNGKNIVVTSLQGAESTFIDGNQDGTVVTFSNGEDSTAILSGFTITNGNGSGQGVRGGGIFCISSSPTLRDLIVTANQAEKSGAGLWFGSSNSRLVDLVISDNSVVGDYYPAGGGISMNNNSDLTMDNILVVGNEAGWGPGIELWDSSDPTMNNITVVGNTGNYGGGILLASGCHPIINNSIFWGNSPHEIRVGESDTVSVSYSDVSGGQDAIEGNGTVYWGEGNMNEDPMFCDPENGDYSVSAFSPLIGAASDGETIGAFSADCGFEPIITEVTDVPNDQGGWIYLGFSRCIFDQEDITDQLYTIYRYDMMDDSSAWVGLLSVGAIGEEHYYVEVHTNGDSTAEDSGMGTYKVVASMNEGIYHSDEMSGYSVDNIAPGVPTGLQAMSMENSIFLSWDMSEEEDFQYFVLERSNEDTEMDDQIIITYDLIDITFEDVDLVRNVEYSYRLAAYDDASNRSDFTDPVSAILLSTDQQSLLPEAFALHQNYPNPFNPTTQIRYDLPEESYVNINIYDLMGRKIKSLINTHQDPGYRIIQWNATNEFGQPVSAGMYIYTIQAGEFRQTRKMVLLK